MNLFASILDLLSSFMVAIPVIKSIVIAKNIGIYVNDISPSEDLEKIREGILKYKSKKEALKQRDIWMVILGFMFLLLSSAIDIYLRYQAIK